MKQDITLFESIKEPATKVISFDDYLKLVHKGDNGIRKKIESLRVKYKTDPPAYKKGKMLLPAVTVSAVFNPGTKRLDSNVKQHSGIIAIDLDVKDNKLELLNNFEDDNALAWHHSVSGEGLVVYYRIEPDVNTHRQSFIAVSELLKTKGYVPDKSVSSISNYRYVSFDKKLKINKRAPIIKPGKLTEQKIVTTMADLGDQQELLSLADQIDKDNVSILDNRADWIKAGAIIHRAFGGNDEGLKVFDRLSKHSSKYKNLADCRKTYRTFDRQTFSGSPASIGTLIYLAGEAGIKPTQPKIKQFKKLPEDPEKETWRDHVIDEEPPEDIPLIQFQDIPVCTVANHSLVVGKKKSRKTLFLAYMIEQYIHRDTLPKDVVLIDTEQGQRHVWNLREKIKKMTGKYITILYLRGESPKRRMKFIREMVADLNPKVLIIDGIRDLLFDINDPKECTEVVTWIERLTVERELHVVNVLHLNKTDSNARGHIGSELLNKAETTIELELDKDHDVTIVSCESSRGVPFEKFAFTHDLKGLPKLVDIPSSKKIKVPTDELNAKLELIFKGGELKYAELVDEVKANFDLGIVKAKAMVADLSYRKLIQGVGVPRSPDYRYRLIQQKQQTKQ